MNSGKIISVFSLFAVIILGLLVLTGWQFDIQVFKRIFPGLVAMNPLTAITFVMVASALILIRYDNSFKYKRLTAILAIAVTLAGILRIADQMLPNAFSIDTLLYHDKLLNDVTGIPNRMAINTAINLVLLGIAVLLLNIKRNRAWLADYFAGCSALIGLLSIMGYIYNARELYEEQTLRPMALHTAIGFCILSLGVLSHKKESGFIKEFTSRYGGKQISFILVPVALVIPGLLGFLSLQAEKAGYFSDSFGTALVALLNAVILIFFIGKISGSVNLINYTLSKEIDNRKKTEDELKKSYLFLDTVIENIPMGVFVKDPEHLTYQRINKEAQNFLNLPKEQVLGKTDYDIFLKEEADFIRERDMQALQNSEIITTQEQRLVRNDKEFWVNTQKIPVKDSSGKSIFLLGIAQNITLQKKQQDRIKEFNLELERKVYERTKDIQKSELKFRALTDNGIDGVRMMDADGLIFYASESIERILGFTPQQMIFTQWFSYIHPDDLAEGKKIFKNVLAGHSTTIMYKLRFRNKAGNFLHVEGSVTNLLHNENVQALVCNFHDVTEREVMLNERGMLEKALVNEKLNREKQIAQATIDGEEKERTAIGMELHDNINQILGAVKLYIGMAKSRPELIIEMLDKSEENLAICINEVRRLSKALVSPDLKQGLSNSVRDLIETLREFSGLEIKYKAEEELLHGYDNLTSITIYRIIQEQLNNIVKHSGACHVTISFAQTGNWVTLKITDNGKGFDTATTNKGIGLKNIANRVEFLKGTLNIISAPGKGCTITIMAPVAA